jgi:hypothetical protein
VPIAHGPRLPQIDDQNNDSNDEQQVDQAAADVASNPRSQTTSKMAIIVHSIGNSFGLRLTFR